MAISISGFVPNWYRIPDYSRQDSFGLDGISMKWYNKLLVVVGLPWTVQILLAAQSPLFAIDQEDQLHIAAHAGATYAITHGTEVICTKITDKKLTCTIVGVVLANAVNIGRKGIQGWPNDTNRAVWAGVAGSAGAVLMITIDW